MCLAPIIIVNKTRRFVRGLSKPLFTVPCGHCAECAARTQDDWFVRAIFETRRVESRGGAVWVPILTYKNEDLPMWHDPEFDYHIPCFDPTHIKRFRDRLRMYFKRHGSEYGLPEPKDENTIRYICCSEYGDEKGRSHVHCLLYVPFRVPAKFMRDAIDYAWTYGMVRYSKLGMMARGMRAARYSMKYVSKDMCWSNKYETDKYETMLKEKIHSEKDREESQKYRDRLNAFRRHKPRHFQSMGFGVDGVDYFKNGDGSWNVERCVQGTLDGSRLGVPPMKSGETFQYNMPAYYVRKIFYNPDEWNLYRMTEFGQEIFSIRFGLSLKREAEKYSVYLTPSDLAAHTAFLDGINPVDVSERVNLLMDGRSMVDLALFNIVYKDIAGTDDNECLISHMNSGMSDSECLSILHDNALDFMLAQKTIDREPDPKNSYNRSHANVEFGFNDVPCFRGFCEVLDIIRDIELKIGQLKQDAAEIKRERERKLGLYQDSYISSNLIFCEL